MKLLEHSWHLSNGFYCFLKYIEKHQYSVAPVGSLPTMQLYGSKYPDSEYHASKASTFFEPLALHLLEGLEIQLSRLPLHIRASVSRVAELA